MKWLLYIVLCLPLAGVAAEEGSVGLGVDVSVEGFLFPKLTEVKVIDVQQGSPAQRANISVGDYIVAIEGCLVPGCPAKKAKKSLSKNVGEAVTLGLRAPGGEDYSVTLVAE